MTGGDDLQEGTLFSLSANGSGFKLRHTFTGGATDGSSPSESLILSGSTLYGMTYHGAWPRADLVVSGSALFGMTDRGGGSGCDGSGCGVIFSLRTALKDLLTVVRSGTGTVISTPSGIDCGETCRATYVLNARVTLAASPAAGSTFSGWSGDCKGRGTCKVVVNAAKSVGAAFDAVTCTYTISGKSKAFNYQAGTVKVSITAKAPQGSGPANCAVPDISKEGDWIDLSSFVFQNNKGSVQVSVPLNDSSSGRSGTVTVADKEFTVTQKAKPCTLLLSASSGSIPASGGPGSFTVTADPADCTFTATDNKDWITIDSGTPGAGAGEIDYTAGENTARSSRSGSIKVIADQNKASKTYTVKQAGAQ